MNNHDFESLGIAIPWGRRTGNVKTFCPQCRDRRTNRRDKSLSVDVARGLYHCHYCGWHGRIGIGNRELGIGNRGLGIGNRELLGSKKPIPNSQIPNPTPQEYDLSANMLAWLARRGISEQTARRMRLTEGPTWMPQVGHEVNTLRFNYFLRGELVNIKYRSLAKHFRQLTGTEHPPYNIDAIRGVSGCIITEGEMDALSWVEAGVNTVISVPNGASSLGWVDEYYDPYLADKRVIYLAMDADRAGVQMAAMLSRRLGYRRCRMLAYPAGCKDSNDVLRRYGPTFLRSLLAH